MIVSFSCWSAYFTITLLPLDQSSLYAMTNQTLPLSTLRSELTVMTQRILTDKDVGSFLLTQCLLRWVQPQCHLRPVGAKYGQTIIMSHTGHGRPDSLLHDPICGPGWLQVADCKMPIREIRSGSIRNESWDLTSCLQIGQTSCPLINPVIWTNYGKLSAGILP